ncbi:tRNA uridine-5-carboxymethylaminomethyl(34) synthesis enzyme MnmG [endosymbiont GvMRE of Glomus versiforme]|uniref:tRNA uridine-5-carboxymethylaminomethyl(34) synthesis enzyme MnmG n=1 Tax=endosymbiont GvMRE of Glomus versiforme TaxID=2039283 RepID=UPI000ECAFAC6|nr:tRNA uridine-5-carboxymethylaminomethyl(34) synthesis enzyme MnmG [endosymbiont GvMRE of Glomus versiforme]RHZ36945.1 tRNA uridine 5-carboxymethylaminomethyl modification enzyme MnmG [endosymbiont GvMRE of Glomus versiforme]
MKNVDIIVIGGGHAGIEAACISAKLGNKVCLVTLNKEKIGFMPCNPSIGGSAKGIVVREIDALGGVMGQAADATALQFKLLNYSSDPAFQTLRAIQALRVQSDKVAYSRYMQNLISQQKNLEVIEGAVESLLIEKNNVIGVKLTNQQKISSKIVILTTGTYLQPITYKGKESHIEGPDGEKKVINNISQQLKELGFQLKRFKTGTSPRILKNSVDCNKFKLEPGHNLPLKFSYHSKNEKLLPFNKQLPCYLLYTNEKTHQIIRDNSHLSPIFYKPDMGTPPRHCPSIEHKVCRFIDKERHQVFVEPQSQVEDTDEEKSYYLQGLSTSLPIEVQKKILMTLPGFEKAQVQKWGYAIEYDVVDSTQLKKTLETELINNFFTAGQINGTTGYEEAAAQGIIAGINASQKIKNLPPLILGREQAYIGVLIDDLVKGIDEPHRLLTSWAEYRSLLRHDNADTRLYSIARELGLLDEAQWEEFQHKQELQKIIAKRLQELKFTFSELSQYFPKVYADNQAKLLKKITLINAYELLIKGQRKISLADLSPWVPEIKKLTWEGQRECEINIKYEYYIKRQEQQVEKMKKLTKELENKWLPSDIDYDQLNLSKKEKEKLKKKAHRPLSLNEVRDIVSPDSLLMLSYYCKQHNSH